MPMATPTIRITSRPTRPSLSGMSAKPEAIPVANGFTVEPSTPMPAAEQDHRRADERVVARRDHHGDDQDVEGEALLRHAEGRPADGEDGHQQGDQPSLVAPQPLDEQRRSQPGSPRSSS